MTDPDRPSPVPTRAVAVELARSAALVLSLVAATVVLLVIKAWVVAAIVGALTIAAFVVGVVPHPRQVAAARRPPEVSDVAVEPWQRGREVWAALDPGGAGVVCVPLRSHRHARRLVPGVHGLYRGQVAGPLRPGEWVVLQVGGFTFWPAGRVLEGVPADATVVVPRPQSRRRPFF